MTVVNNKNTFDKKDKYKLYRDVYSIIHPSISKKNISDYKIILKDELSALRVFYPKKVSTISSIIIFIHGNGYITGSVGSYTKICSEISKRCDTLVIALDYNEGKFLVNLKECYATVKYLYNELEKLNIDPKNISLLGDSTGANLVNGITIKGKKDGLNIKNQILINPISNNIENIEKNKINIIQLDKIEKFFNSCIDNENDYNNPLVFPIKNKDYKDFPNTLIIVGASDPLLDYNIKYHNLLKKNNINTDIVKITFASHNILNSDDDEIKDEFYKKLKEFLNIKSNS